MSITKNLSTNNLILTASLVVLISANSILCDPHPWGENICNRTVPIKKDIVIEQPVQYKIKVQSMCGLLPCVKTRFETRTDQSIKTILQQVEKSTCCPGYAETQDRKCAPICLKSCSNGGECIAPGTCKCSPKPTDMSPGFVGPTCARFVCFSDDRWGAKCDKKCDCPSSNSYCSADTGKCLCYPGWRGINCTLECDLFSDTVECRDHNRLPPIIDPESNLMNANLMMERQRPEALVLDDEVKIVAENGHDWRSLASNYIIVALSIVSLVSVIAFLVIRKRYEQVRDELYSNSASNYAASSTYSSGPPPYDSTSQSSSPSSGVTVMVPSNGNLEKNFSFAAATRNILLGKDLNSLHQTKSDGRNRMVLHPRAEAHLINSQKKAEQNDYTMNMSGICNDLRNPSAYTLCEDHVYQVPKSTSPSARTHSYTSNLVADNSHNLDRTLEDDSTSNIYEEIKPRKL